jgi:hypothetical protein
MKLKLFVMFSSMFVLIISGLASAGPLQIKTPKISVSPASVNLGNVKLGGTSEKLITVKNTGTSDLVISDITITGSNASEFNETDDCTTVLAGGSCTVTGTFVPTSMGNKSAVLNISSNDPKKPTGSAKLSGKATSPAPGTSTWDSATWDSSTWAE